MQPKHRWIRWVLEGATAEIPTPWTRVRRARRARLPA